PPPPRPQTASAPRLAQGTAFFVRPDGVLLTALHVVEGARSIAVACPGREPASATLGNSARGRDLVVLKTALAAPAYLSLRDTRSLLPGDPIFTVGFPVAGTRDAAARFAGGAVGAVSRPPKTEARPSNGPPGPPVECRRRSSLPRPSDQNRAGQSRSCLTGGSSGTTCSSLMCPITQIAPACDSGTVAASPRIFATSSEYE